MYEKIVPYSARITRQNPSAFIFLLDRSQSMEEPVWFYQNQLKKSEALALIMNNMIGELLTRCKREEGYRDYFDVAILGYSGSGVRPLLVGRQGSPFCSISDLDAMKTPRERQVRERTLPNGMQTVTSVESRVWITPEATGKTPMGAALSRAYELASSWIQRRAKTLNFPPIIFNVTDGEASDATDEMLLQLSEQIRGLATKNGNVLLINIHISSSQEVKPIVFPRAEAELGGNRYARILFRMSSQMPPLYREEIALVRGAESPGELLSEEMRGMSFNATLTHLIRLMNIGSVSVNLIE